jgi:periplasmic protein TonB
MQVRAALPISAAGHAAIIGLLLLLPAVMPPPKIDLSNAVEVVFAPAPPLPAAARPPTPPVATQPAAPPVVEQLVPPPPVAPVVQAEPPPPPPKPTLKLRPKPVPPVDPPTREMTLPLPVAPAPAAPPQVASLPPQTQAPVISADYRSLLSSWLESHKRYPEDARQRGEEGRAVLRFRVDRNGRVLDYAVVTSTGYADLDAAVESMMRGATLPPFPASMTSPEIEVSVTVRFGLKR